MKVHADNVEAQRDPNVIAGSGFVLCSGWEAGEGGANILGESVFLKAACDRSTQGFGSTHVRLVSVDTVFCCGLRSAGSCSPRNGRTPSGRRRGDSIYQV